MQPLALDLFCGGGGVCLGLQRAGFRVVGMDHRPQPDYPGDFLLADALRPPVDLADFALVWASPPCQAYVTVGKNAHGDRGHPDLVADTRRLLTGHPVTCIENVPGAPLRPTLSLSGDDFGEWRYRRKRIFETSFTCHPPLLSAPPRPANALITVSAIGAGGANGKFHRRRAGMGLPTSTSIAEIEDAFGVHHIKSGTAAERRRTLNQMVPPIYAEWIGRQAMEAING